MSFRFPHLNLLFVMLALWVTTPWVAAAPPKGTCRFFLHPLFNAQIAVFQPETYPTIQQHSIYRLNQFIKERELTLKFQFEDEYFKKKYSQAFMGEALQARMLARLLRIIFPESAEIELKPASDPQFLFPSIHVLRQGEVDITVVVQDSADTGDLPDAHKINIFEMSLLKQASPLTFFMNREMARAELRIPKETKVASFYLDELLTDEHASAARPSIASLVRSIPTEDKPDLIFVSLSTVGTYQNEALILNKISGYTVTSLSDLMKAKEIPSLPLLVFNDYPGKMPLLYASSNWALIRGALNLFEPLQLKIPTLVFDSPESLDGYQPEVFQQMLETAQKTQGVVRVQSNSSLPEAIRKVVQINPSEIKHPAFITQAKGNESSFNTLLDQIQRLVLKSLGRRGDLFLKK